MCELGYISRFRDIVGIKILNKGSYNKLQQLFINIKVWKDKEMYQCTLLQAVTVYTQIVPDTPMYSKI